MKQHHNKTHLNITKNRKLTNNDKNNKTMIN